MAITLTEQAAEHIKHNILKKENQYLRFGVKVSGCTGFRYVLEIAEKVESDDIELTCLGVNIVIKKDDLVHVDGTQIDFVKEKFSEMFAFNNPKVAAACGCGESFSTQ